MPVLTRTENISRASYLKVAQGYLEARAEFREIAYRRESFRRDIAERLALPVGKVGVGAACAPADSAAYLMKLGKSHRICIFYNQRVGIRNIDACFDYRGADEDIGISLDKALPDIGKLLFFHSAVRYIDIRIGKFLFQPRRSACDIFYPVVQVENLPAAMELAPNRLVYHEVVIFQNICLDRHSVARCLVEHGHIAYRIHRHIQRSRYRRCRQRQNIDILRYLLQLLLVGDAEALFFVYYDESEVMKLYIGG